MLNAFATLIKTTAKINICRDKKDNFLLAICKDGNADYLITGDSDLLELNPFSKTEIISYQEFTLKFKN